LEGLGLWIGGWDGTRLQCSCGYERKGWEGRETERLSKPEILINFTLDRHTDRAVEEQRRVCWNFNFPPFFSVEQEMNTILPRRKLAQNNVTTYNVI